MSRKYFGTDGVRGTVGSSPMTPDFVLRLGYAGGKVLSSRVKNPGVLIGKDTRISGYMLESALEAGFSAAGVDVHMCGPIPTPAVAYLTRALRLSAGVVISASHNPYPDNGIKIFSGDGFKLPDEAEALIEAEMEQPMACNHAAKLGKVWRVDDAGGRYIEFCKSTFPTQLDLRGLRLVVDCAHGAAYDVAPHVFHELGADVAAIGVEPDGLNINDQTGATAPAALRQQVLDRQADLGIGLDGDADRVVMIDAAGRLYDGDQLLYAVAKHRASKGGVSGVAGTLMTNLAFENAMQRLGIPFGPTFVSVDTNAVISVFAASLLGLGLNEAYAAADKDGSSVGDELRRIGYLGPAEPGTLRPHAFVELHIEQGPILDEAPAAVAGQGRQLPAAPEPGTLHSPLQVSGHPCRVFRTSPGGSRSNRFSISSTSASAISWNASSSRRRLSSSSSKISSRTRSSCAPAGSSSSRSWLPRRRAMSRNCATVRVSSSLVASRSISLRSLGVKGSAPDPSSASSSSASKSLPLALGPLPRM